MSSRLTKQWFVRFFVSLCACGLVAGLTGSVVAGSEPAADSGDLVQVHQDFSKDPGWEGVNNRIVGKHCPTAEQDFGWRPTNHTKAVENGEIGGLFFNIRTPAWYGMKLERPLTFNDEFSVSGRFSITTPWFPKHGGAYIGFFNSKHQGWKPWNAFALRVGGLYTLDYMSESWRCAGAGMMYFPPDGKPHTFWFKYEPNITVAAEWPDPRLKEYVKLEKQPEATILEIAMKSEPGITAEDLHKRLIDAEKEGLVIYETRRGIGWRMRNPEDKVKGRVSLQIDNERVAYFFLYPFHRDEPLSMDRFGLFNLQLPDPAFPLEAYFGDLEVNGKKLELAKDPVWEGSGNHVKFVEKDFHARLDYGYSRTNHAGEKRGEIGGLFWRTEPIDPNNGYYADDVGMLTLEDPLSVSGTIAFLDGGTDGGMGFGYFNSKNKMKHFTGAEAGHPTEQSLTMIIDGPTRIGYYFSPILCPTLALTSGQQGPVYVPDGKKHQFSLTYDPKANNNIGRVVTTFDGIEYAFNLSPEQRKQGATFDRFGMMNCRRGGKYAVVYLDDLTYTARRPKDYKPVFHKEEFTVIPYPENGRKF